MHTCKNNSKPQTRVFGYAGVDLQMRVFEDRLHGPDFTSDAGETRSAPFPRNGASPASGDSFTLDGEDRRRIGDRGGKGAQLKGDNLQIGNSVEVPRVIGTDRVTKFQRTRADDEIRNGQIDSFSCLFATNASNDLCRCLGDGMHGNRRFEFVEESASSLADLRYIGAIDPVTDLGNR